MALEKQKEEEELELKAQAERERELEELHAKEREKMHFANQNVNENTVFFAIALPNTNVLNLCQYKEKLVISKSMWKTVQIKF